MTSDFRSHEPAPPFVIGIGEILWDLLPAGPAIGGASGNFACHAAALGARAMLASRVGDDEPGRTLVQRLQELGVDTAGIAVDAGHPTGSVEVALGGDGVPEFSIRENVAWDHIQATPSLEDAFRRADAVCFGTLAQRSPESAHAIRGLLGEVKPGALRVFDLNLRVHPFPAGTVDASLALADVVKLNEEELDLVSAHLGLTGSTHERLAALVARYRLRLAACTLGPEGSILHTGAAWAAHPGFPVDARDTVGAGDSFLAAVTLGLLSGWPLDAIAAAANEVAAHVCSCHGAVPSLPGHLRARFRDRHLMPSS